MLCRPTLSMNIDVISQWASFDVVHMSALAKAHPHLVIFVNLPKHFKQWIACSSAM